MIMTGIYCNKYKHFARLAGISLCAIILFTVTGCSLGNTVASGSSSDPSSVSITTGSSTVAGDSANNPPEKGSDINPGKNVLNKLGDLSVNDLFDKRLGEVIDILGPDHSEPEFFEGGTYIGYDGSCNIFYSGSAALDKEPQIEPDAEISAISIFQELNVYKGLSVGQTLDEMNRNPEIKNKLIAESEGEGNFVAVGIYKYNGHFISIWPFFNDDMICISIFIKYEQTNDSGYPVL